MNELSTTPDGKDPWGEPKKWIGKKFPITDFKQKNGKPYSKNAFIGKPTLINFWFTRCPPCIEEMPILNKLKEKFGNKVNFVGITFENEKSVENFLKTNSFTFSPQICNAKTTIDKLGVDAYPTIFILDKNGVLKKVLGGVSEFEVKEVSWALESLK